MDKVAEYRLAVYEESRKAMNRINKREPLSFDDWMRVGQGIAEMRIEALAVPGIGNRDDTLAFRREFGEILKREKLHDEQAGPDKTTRGFLLKIIGRDAEVRAWYGALPKGERLAWNHPSSIWRHFDKSTSKPKAPKASKTTGLTAEEEAQCVENAQIVALQKRDDKIASLRETNGEQRTEIDRLNAEVVHLRQVISALLRRLGIDASDIATDDEIASIGEEEAA